MASRAYNYRKPAVLPTAALLFAALALAACGVNAGIDEHYEPPKGDNVVELEPAGFNAAINDGRVWFVEFYVPWCRCGSVSELEILVMAIYCG